MENENWQNKRMGGMAMGHVKTDKESIALLKQIINILKKDMEDYHKAMFTYAMDFFQ